QGIKLTPRHYAYLKISEGCNHRCTFCIIPSMRGDLASRPVGEVMAEAEKLVAAGVKELLVISQDTSAYGVDVKYRTGFWGGRPLKTRMTELCAALGSLGAWVRLHYVYPYPHVDEVIALMSAGRILPYLDVPFQHASPRILKLMKRPASSEKNLERIAAWRAACPDITLRSTFIVGFPGETEAEFESLLDFLREARLDRVGCFAYSPVEGAKANALPDAIAEEVKEERRARFMQVQAQISREKLRRKVGRTLDVLVDEVSDEVAVGRSAADAPEIDGVVRIARARARAGPSASPRRPAPACSGRGAGGRARTRPRSPGPPRRTRRPSPGSRRSCRARARRWSGCRAGRRRGGCASGAVCSCRDLFRGARKVEPELGPTAGRGVEPDAPAEPLDDVAADREAEAAAFGAAVLAHVGLAEALEDAAAEMLGDAGAAIAHRGAHPAVGERLRAHGDHRAARGELRRVEEQVREHLDQAVLVATHAQFLRRLEIEPHAVGLDEAAARLDRLAKHRGPFEERDAEGAVAGGDLLQVEEVVHEAHQPFAVLHGDRDQPLRLVAQLARHAALQQAERAAHRGERRAQLVARHGDEAVLHAVEVLEARDVEAHGDRGGDAPVRVAQRHVHHLEVHRAAHRIHHLLLEARGAALERGVHVRLDLRVHRLAAHLLHAPAVHRLGGEPRELEVGAIVEENALVRAEHHDRGGHRVDQLAQLLLTLLQALLGGDASADVRVGAGEAPGPSARVVRGDVAAALAPDVRVVRAAHAMDVVVARGDALQRGDRRVAHVLHVVGMDQREELLRGAARLRRLVAQHRAPGRAQVDGV